jgi:ABC-type sugar transport system substrate-binding protein
VLDATSPPRQLWNQVLHRHPQVGGLARGATLAAFVARDGAPRARQDAIRALQQLNVRFVIVDDDTVAAGRALRLDRAYDGDGLVVFEVPPRAG